MPFMEAGPIRVEQEGQCRERPYTAMTNYLHFVLAIACPGLCLTINSRKVVPYGE